MNAMPWPRWIDEAWKVNLREVAPGIFVGGHFSVRRFHPGRMTGVVALSRERVGEPPDLTSFYAALPRERLVWAPMEDGEGIAGQTLDRALSLARSASAERPLLIHCQAGLSRSVSVAYGVLRILYGLSSDEALARVRGSRDTTFPLSITLRSARTWVDRRRAAASVLA